jgi:hypothetical protein
MMVSLLVAACSQLDVEPNQPGDDLRVLALEASNDGPIGTLLTDGVDYTSGPGGNVQCSDINIAEFASSIPVTDSDDNEPTGGVNFDNSPEFFKTFEDFGFKITVTDGKYVSWEYIGELCLSEVAVVVKGSAGANVYYYSVDEVNGPFLGELLGDNGLVSPVAGGSGGAADLSNLRICYTEVPCDDDKCYEFDGETAWSAGTRYVTRGNWATYTAYDGEEKTEILFALALGPRKKKRRSLV